MALNALGNVYARQVALIAIDSLDLPACDFIKVDAERMEGDAIAGAEQTLRRFRPLLYVANSRQENSASLIRQLLALDYRLYWHLPLLFNPQNYFEAGENIFAGNVSVHMLGIHASVSQTVTGFREITGPQDSWRDAIGSCPHDVPAGGSRQALEGKPDDAEAHYALGLALHDQGKLGEAIACYRRALELNPHNAEAHNNLGVALMAEGQLEEAVACYRQALQRKPDYAEAHNNLGNALKAQGARTRRSPAIDKPCNVCRTMPRRIITWALPSRGRESWRKRWSAAAGLCT